MRLIWAAALVLAPLSAAAQDRAQTLADIKAELGTLQAEFNSLKRELVSTGAATSGAAGGSALQRMDAMEAALSQVTAKAEELELRINRVVADGTNRVGDLEFRVCELEEGCDIGALGETKPLGGEAPAAPVATPAPAPAADAGGAELAVSEKADFDRAQEVLGQGDFRTAADLFKTFAETYTGGPLTYEAHFLRGEALSQLGETANAARAYLESFSGAPNGPRAPEALLKLGRALGDLKQTPEACVTLAEVGTRFPGSAPALEAATAMQGLGCN
ncbi:tol-pal system protein YbgF [Cereibacter sphaeroides]|uniref:tol-pal system protein YbgF n=1 Tax=Rhodobacterales TaxID=204455 RepID=UPI000BBE0C14|nr:MULTISPECIES: tol-pal system protein YbgF [Paracoccaceae]MCE6949888.1 tol-pal system protein YbgF [Cereibacter sphaeroides]MCE6959406.1 tol-pal system protein YbgF [Cereibacter sphaeroides]MCE6967412.1 tol-pal system protein YbgF [Cereibacter sphaeroides]MCE6973823.1 tol-pal system protein YbgF [Cereibacter sphaeroides]